VTVLVFVSILLLASETKLYCCVESCPIWQTRHSKLPLCIDILFEMDNMLRSTELNGYYAELNGCYCGWPSFLYLTKSLTVVWNNFFQLSLIRGMTIRKCLVIKKMKT